MDAGQIMIMCLLAVALILCAIIMGREIDNIKSIGELPVSDTEREREKHKKEIAKKLAKLHRKPDLILCECWYLWANIDGKVISEICGVPVLYAGLLYGKSYVFVWFDDFDKEANEKCEKILKEQKK